MNHLDNHGRTRLTRIAGAICALGMAGSTHAVELKTGNPDLTARIDTTLRYNLATRVEKRDDRIANNPVFDESDYKFDRGDLVNNRLDLFTEMDVVYQRRMGFRVSAAGWYDGAYNDKVRTNPAFSARSSYVNDRYNNAVKRFYAGPSGEVLDAFVFGNVDLGTVPVNIKVGKHSNYWGESTFNVNHSVAYSQMPSDSRKSLSSPGVEAKETVLPVNSISAQAQVSDNLSVAVQYFLDWKPNRLPEGGTYYGASDFLFNADRFSLAPGFFINRRDALEPDRKRGNFGVNARWSPEWLDGTVGIYYRKMDERQPWAAPQINAVPGGFYRLVYARDTELLGLSVSKGFGGVAVNAELSYRRNGAFINTGINPLTLEGPRGNSYHGILNGTVLTKPGSLADTLTLVAELAWSRWDKVTANPNLFKAYGSVPATTCAAGEEKYNGCATKTYVGISVLASPKWLQVFPGADLSMPLFLGYGLHGNAATLSGGNQGSGNISAGLSLEYLAKYTFDLKYTDFVGKFRAPAGVITTSNGAMYSDRGLLAFTFKTNF